MPPLSSGSRPYWRVLWWY
ncbi:hypothetical protein MTR67_045136 [Solanum verrucosum]|uniref:Uncharacterized protein n=1 Tax=Solanum verrucosum TaxID=315347 RepID=A0AAF0ZUA6_SOLVR|nr:hypothetical protein MTR67_045136 [Solanum verrucosum]